jgi:glycosyltransferase involved in cell wall biosynthesis
MSKRRLSILIVTQFAPPAGFSAARRVAGLTKYLSRAGHRVTVLTSIASGSGPIAGAAKVVRARDLIVSGVNWRRKHFESLREVSGADYEDAPSRLAWIVVPDLSLLSWLPFALVRALGLAPSDRYDWVVTTSPPESAHLVGLALRRKGVRWVADLRDGWTFETTHPDWPLAAQRRLDAALERLVARRADLVTGVTDPITDDLRERLGANAVTVSNGFDPDEWAGVRPDGSRLSDDRFSFVHTGRMAFSGRSTAPLVEALGLIARRHPQLAERLEVVLAGPLSASERGGIAAAGLGGMLRPLGTLPRSETLGLQAAADGLLLITGRGRRSEATAKLFEYLAARRPVLVLGEGTAAANIVQQAGAGRVAAADDPEAIAAGLAALAEAGAEARTDAQVLDSYSYASIAAALERRLLPA